MPNKRGISPLTTWHSQGGLLLISFTWGMSYIIPSKYRIPFSEVFPNSLGTQMWAWGAALLVAATSAFVAERVVAHSKGKHSIAWRAGYGSHMVLAAVYITLAVCALVEGAKQIHGPALSWPFWGLVLSAVSRPVLWGYIGYLHTTYARLPHPQGVK